MDKSRDGERGEKTRGSGIPQGLDPTTAALYANMLGAGGLGAYAAAAAISGLGGQPMQLSYPPVSTSAGLASLAAIQQAQQQAAAIASLGPSAAAWCNLAGMQQMELLSRLQSGGISGMGGYPGGLHPEHLMRIEFLQAQHAAAMAAALSSTSKATVASRTSSNSSSNSGSSTGGAAGCSSLAKSARASSSMSGRHSNSHRSRDPLANFIHSRGAHSSNYDSHKTSSRHYGLNTDPAIAIRSDLGSVGSSNLSYGIASLMADKHHPPSVSSRPPSASTPSESARQNELEIIPLSITPGVSDSNSALFESSSNGFGFESAGLAAHLSAAKVLLKNEYTPLSKDCSSGTNYSTLAGKNETKLSYSGRGLTNGLSLSAISTSEVSIEPVLSSKKNTSKNNGSDDGPLNLSLKPTSNRTLAEVSRKEVEFTEESASELLTKVKSPLSQLDYGQNLGLGIVAHDLSSGLDVLQSLYGQGQQQDILASMQDALQRQLLMVDGNKRDDKKKRPKSSILLEELPREERARHLGRGVSKPKKNTVASLLEHCRAVGIKPQLPLPPVAHSVSCDPPPISSLATTSVTNSPPQLSSSPTSPSTAGTRWESILSVSPLPATPPVSLPPSLVPLLAHTALVPPATSTASQALASLTSLLSSSTSPALFSQSSTSLSNDDTATASKDSKLAVDESTCSLTESHPSLSCKVLNNLSESSILGLSDSDSDDMSSDSSNGEYDSREMLQPWLTTVLNERRENSEGISPPLKKRKMITDEISLRVPLYHGWKRETIIRGIAQSGIRGEVVYYAPCGKTFKQYPDIMRYLERLNITEISRDNFSFSSKIPVGEYIDATSQQRYSESNIRKMLSNIRRKRPLQRSEEKQSQHDGISEAESDSLNPVKKSERDALEVEAEVILRRLDAEERALKVKLSLHHKMEEQSQLRAVKEQEKLKKQEELRKEKEEQKKQREEINRQRLYEQLKKAQEREQEKQKQKILKEQLYLQKMSKQREMLYNLELERERRRYHGILVKTLESRKRFEEREKRREVLREEKKVFKEKKREERLAARELNLLMKEVREDMELTDHRRLPLVEPLEGLKLPPEAFGNVFMIFEFLNNFGETLGFDMDSLPSLQSLQLAMLGDHESEEELLNILTHLLVCTIEDPGVPNSQRNTTILGQTLNKADITATNLSEVLRIYLYANATGEVRTVHGLHGTEKERRESPSKSAEWEDRLAETESYRMSTWLQKLPLTALTVTQKGAVVAYICNELLQNKAVIRQIEDSLDKHNGLKTHKWKLDARIRSLCRRLKMGMHRKKLFNTHVKGGSEVQIEDSNMSAPSWTEDKDDDDDHVDDSGGESDVGMEEAHDEEEDKNLNFEEATKTLESLQKQMDAVRQELFDTAQQVRGYNCGQDRFQRTMWVLPHAGGPFLEGLSSCDYTGREHFPLEIPTANKKDGFSLKEIENLMKDRKMENEKEEIDKVKQVVLIKEELTEVVSNVYEPAEVKSEIVEEEPSKENDDIKIEEEEHPEKENINCSMSSTEGVDKDLIGTGLGLIPGQYLRPEHVAQCEKLNFDLLPRNACDPITMTHLPILANENSPKLPESPLSPHSSSSTPLLTMTPMLQQSINAHNMSHKELLEKLHQTAEALPIPPEYKSGWWHIKNLDLLKEIVQALNDRGAREKELKRFLERNFNIVKNAITKIDPNVISLEEICAVEEDILYDEFGVPIRDDPTHWKLDIALKMDMLALEAVFALEEKITNASMQTKNWKLGDPGDKVQEFQPSCLSNESDVQTIDIAGHLKGEDHHEEWTILMNTRNPIHVGRARLLYLEDGIERRYLKPPLGHGVKCSPGALSVPKPEGNEAKVFEPTRSLSIWQEAVVKCDTAAQLSMCTYMLETGVAWDKSIMKAYCQFCHSGDFEDKLLLCDSCDKGYHMHCFKPPMQNIPEGDWYCYECVNKFSDSGHRHCLACGGIEGKNLIHCVNCPRAYHTTCLQPPLAKTPRAKWNCPACATKCPRTKRNRPPPRKISESFPAVAAEAAVVEAQPPVIVTQTATVVTNGAAPPPTPAIISPSPEPPVVEEIIVESSPSTTADCPQDASSTTPKKEKTIKKKDVKELSICRQILNGLESHDDSWPFMTPVNTRQFPTYKKIIKKPVDISTIRKKLDDYLYRSKEDYSEDIELMFNNCEIFNEDDSPVGKAGHNLRTFYQNKWKEHFATT